MKRTVLAMVAGGVLFAQALQAGEGFRVDTDVFKNGDKTPIVETQTLFQEGHVYDFVLAKPIEITIYDAVGGKITLLDVDRRLKTVITTSELLEYVFALKTQSTEANQPLFTFAFDPKFEPSIETYSENEVPKARVKLASPLMTYTAVGVKPKQPEAVTAYREFADCYARLNATRGNLPPGARMALNRTLAEQGLVPQEVHLTLTHNISGEKRKLDLVSRHLINWNLSGEDQKRIQDALNMSTAFRVVPFAEFCLPPGKQPVARQAKK